MMDCKPFLKLYFAWLEGAPRQGQSGGAGRQRGEAEREGGRDRGGGLLTRCQGDGGGVGVGGAPGSCAGGMAVSLGCRRRDGLMVIAKQMIGRLGK